MRLASLAVALALALPPLEAQAIPALHAVGTHDVVWRDPLAAAGSRALAARVCYPSPVGGTDARVATRTGGWPVVVLLHGYGLLGRDYAVLGEAWAARGFAVVLLDTARWSFTAQVADGIAVFGALAAANTAAGGFFRGAFDGSRVAIAGHSMGGGALALVLGSNPGYRCALALAPVWPGAAAAAGVQVPIGIVVGAADATTPWATSSQPYFHTAAPASGFKFCYLLGPGCGHLNLAGLGGAAAGIAADRAFLRTMDLGVGFFRHCLDLDATALDRCFGPVAVDEPLLLRLDREIVQPAVWVSNRLRSGRPVRVSVAAQPGFCAILAGPALAAPAPTSIGPLRLDPAYAFPLAVGLTGAGGEFDTVLSVPGARAIVGTTLALQALGAGAAGAHQLGAAIELTVER